MLLYISSGVYILLTNVCIMSLRKKSHAHWYYGYLVPLLDLDDIVLSLPFLVLYTDNYLQFSQVNNVTVPLIIT